MCRRGSLVPAVAVALLVVGAFMAVVLDRLWIDAARVELLTAAEAAALASAAELASDERLRDPADLAPLAPEARNVAIRVAAENYVGGQPLRLDQEPGSDVRIGRIIRDDAGRDVFLETDNDPKSVAVFATRQRSGSNPVALFLRELTGASRPNVSVVAEASIDNRIVGVTAIPGGAIPALPLAVLEVDPSGVQLQTWVHQVEQRGGGDVFRYDAESALVVAGADGLPELALTSAPASATPQSAAGSNLRLLDLGSGLDDQRLATQVAFGLTYDHLADFDRQLRFDFGSLSIESSGRCEAATNASLAAAIGQTRICFLFTAGSTQAGRVSVPRIVAARIMSVRIVDGDRTEIIVQPAVVSTRTALLNDDRTADVAANPYVYKLQLTQ
ncbi:MAG: hypothetical protein JNG89_03300 [Planctomycetaceae bacterium]|nr:hypothetical protein [Planctomycetaceae bacterium]